MKKEGRPQLHKIAEKAAGVMELPSLFTESEVRLSPSQGLCICGIRETKTFSSDYVVFSLRECELHLHGSDLQIACCENGMALLHGRILGFSFCEGDYFVC